MTPRNPQQRRARITRRYARQRAIVDRMREVLTLHKDAWIQDASATDVRGRLTSPWSKDATCWCLVGALDTATIPGSPNRVKGLLRGDSTLVHALMDGEIARRTGLGEDEADFITWNDEEGRTRRQVLAFLRSVRNTIDKLEQVELKREGLA